MRRTVPSGDVGSAGLRARTLNWVLWTVQGFLAIGFAFAGGSKLAGTMPMVDLFTEIGAGQWLRYAVGALEVAGAVGVLVPRVYGLAALGLTAIMLGAVTTNLVVIGESPAIPLTYLLLSALVTWGRWPERERASSTTTTTA